jgi:TPR repeat protein
MENLELLLEQANNGDAMSQYKLGRAYESGDGVEKNLATARMWYQKSADNGYKNAEVKLRLLPVQQENDATQAEAPKQTYQAPSAPHFATAVNAQSNIGNNQQTQNSEQPQTVTGQKSKAVAAILALFLGSFGAHDFYLGYKKQGIIKIVLTITIVASFVTYLWTLIDLIKILCNGKLDSNGQLLK